MYTISSILKMLESYTWTPLLLSTQYKKLIFSELQHSGIKPAEVEKIIAQDPNMSIGELWTSCYNVLINAIKESTSASYEREVHEGLPKALLSVMNAIKKKNSVSDEVETHEKLSKLVSFSHVVIKNIDAIKKNPELELNEILIKLLPSTQASLECIEKNVQFLLTQYTDKETVHALKKLEIAVNEKIKNLTNLDKRLKKIEKADPSKKPSFSSQIEKYNEFLEHFQRIKNPSENDMDRAEMRKKEYQKLQSSLKAFIAYDKYRQFVKPVLKKDNPAEDKPAAEKKPDNASLCINKLLQTQNELLEKLEEAYTKLDAPQEQLFSYILELNTIKSEIDTLQPSAEEETYKKLPANHEDNLLKYSHSLNKIKTKTELYFKLIDCLNQWKESVKRELLNLFIKRNDHLTLEDYIKNGIIVFSKHQINSAFPFMAQQDPVFKKALQTFKFLEEITDNLCVGTLEKISKKNPAITQSIYIPVNGRVLECYNQLQQIQKKACQFEKFHGQAKNLCVKELQYGKLINFKATNPFQPESKSQTLPAKKPAESTKDLSFFKKITLSFSSYLFFSTQQQVVAESPKQDLISSSNVEMVKEADENHHNSSSLSISSPR